MVTSNTASRSDAIREYLSSNPNAGPREVVAALKEKGIDVKAGLVSNVKHHLQAGGRKSTRRVAKRRRGRVPAMTAPTAPATTGTQAIRAYVKEHPQAGPKEIRNALAAQGVKVSASLVSAVKYRKRRRAPAVRVAVRTVRSAQAAVTLEQLFELKHFADTFGGVEQVRRALDTLAQFS